MKIIIGSCFIFALTTIAMENNDNNILPLSQLCITSIASTLHDIAHENTNSAHNIKEILPTEKMQDLVHYMALHEMHIPEEFNDVEVKITDEDYEHVQKLPKVFEEDRYCIGPGEESKYTQILEYSNLRLTEIDANRFPENLGELSLEHNKLTDFDANSLPVTLRVLNLSHNNLVSFRNVEHIPQLGRLNLSHNRLTEIPNLERMGRSTSIDLSNNNLSVIDARRLPLVVDNLALSNNRIRTLDQLYQLAALCQHKLSLDGNQLENIELINPDRRGFVMLRNGDLYSWGIGEMSLDNNPHLRGVKINGFIALGQVHLRNLPELAKLDFSYNQLTQIPPLTNLPQLRELNLSNNRVATFNENNLPQSIESLNLKNNPLQSISTGRLPNLRKIDCSGTTINIPRRLQYSTIAVCNNAYISLKRGEAKSLLKNPIIYSVIILATVVCAQRIYAIFKKLKEKKQKEDTSQPQLQDLLRLKMPIK